MTVFKTFLKILNKNKFVVILYTVLLLVFGATNMSANQSSTTFTASKPNILIVNNDEEAGITKNFIKYIKENSKTPEVKDNEEARNDALFYEDADYIVYIPKNYNKDFLDGKNPEIEIKRKDSYNSAFAEMMIKRYISVASLYRKGIESEDELIEKINETLSKHVDAQVVTKLDTTGLAKASYYFNFASYSILACLVYVICLILSVFNSEKVRKRNIISSTDYKIINRKLLLSNCVYSAIVWALYVIAGFILVGNVMWSVHGIIYLINSLVFTICATTIAFMFGNIITGKGAVTAIMNIVSLGSSFMCGVFVPQSMLPDVVIKIAHILPTYYYVRVNEAVATLENVNLETLKPLMVDMGIVLAFSLAFIVMSNIVANKKRKI